MNKREMYIKKLEEIKALGLEILAEEEDNWDDFLSEVDNMNDHLEVAINWLKRA